MSTAATGLLATAEAVSVALHPLRRQILSALSGGPASATEVARQIGLPRQKVNYHLRALESLGLLDLDEERPVRGVTERIMRLRHADLLVDPAVLGEEVSGDLDPVSTRGLRAAMAAATQILRRSVQIGRDAGGRRVPTMTLDAVLRLPDPAAQRAFADELADLIARHDKPDEGAMRFHLTTVLLPIPPETVDA